VSGGHDQAEQYAAAWAEFERLDRLASHRTDWATWAAGRSAHRLFMVLVRDPLAVAAISEVQRVLGDVPGVEPHATHFFHISLQTCGFDDELPVDTERVARAVSALPRFHVALGGVNAFHSAVFLETHSGGALLRVRHAVRDALGPGLQAIDPFRDFLFHLTIGYLEAGGEPEAVRRRIRPLRQCQSASVTVERIALVRVPTDQREPFPKLEPLASFELG
jgi:2'-5' RNA ligase